MDPTSGRSSFTTPSHLNAGEQSFIKEMQQIDFYERLEANDLIYENVAFKHLDQNKIKEMHQEAIQLILELKPSDIATIGSDHPTEIAAKFTTFMESIKQLGFGDDNKDQQPAWTEVVKDPSARQIISGMKVPLYAFALEVVNFHLAVQLSKESQGHIINWIDACQAHFAAKGVQKAASSAPQSDAMMNRVIEGIGSLLSYFHFSPKDQAKIGKACQDLKQLMPLLTLTDISSLGSSEETPQAQKFKKILTILARYPVTSLPAYATHSNLGLWSGSLATDAAKSVSYTDDKSRVHSLLLEKSSMDAPSPTVVLFRKAVSAHFASSARGEVHYFSSIGHVLEKKNANLSQQLRDSKDQVIGVLTTGNHFWDGELPVLQNLFKEGHISRVRMHFYDSKTGKFSGSAELNRESFDKLLLIPREDFTEGKTPVLTVGKIKNIINKWKAVAQAYKQPTSQVK